MAGLTFGNVATGAGGIAGAIGGLISSSATAAGDQAAAAGYTQEAQYYGQAATIAGQNVAITNSNTALQQYNSARALSLAQGTTRANAAGNGTALGGSSTYIMSMNAAQGGIATALIGQQGAINANGFQTQEYALQGEQAQATAAAQQAQDAAKASSGGGIFSALGSIVGAVASFA